MSKIDIDSLLESALAKDRSGLPEQQLAPDAALRAKLSATPAASVGALTTTATVGGFAISKVSIFLLGIATFGTAAYFYFQTPDQAPLQQNIVPPTTELSVGTIDSNTVLTTPAKKKTSDSLKAIAKKDSAATPGPISIEDNLILPKNPPKNYPTDSTRVPINMK